MAELAVVIVSIGNPGQRELAEIAQADRAMGEFPGHMLGPRGPPTNVR